MEQKIKNITITLLGGVDVGKTTLINMYLGQEFTDLGLITMGNDKFMTKIKINNNNYNLIIWDTGGTERLRLYSVNAAINSDIIIYVFDVSNLESFEELKGFIRLVQENSDKNYLSCIIGNKTDKLSENEFDDEIIKQYADSNNIMYRLISAKDSIEMFKELVENLIMEYLGIYNNESKFKEYGHYITLNKYLNY